MFLRIHREHDIWSWYDTLSTRNVPNQRRALSLDEEKAYELCASYLNKKQGKKAILKGIGFVQSICAIKVEDIMSKLEDVPAFGLDSDYTRVNNILVVVYIAYKIRVEFLWQRFLNSIIPKFFLKAYTSNMLC